MLSDINSKSIHNFFVFRFEIKNDTTFFNFEMIRKIDTPLSIQTNKRLVACSLFRAGVS